jgi:hypothetical protein
MAQDIAGGAAVILGMLERITIDAECSDGEIPPLISNVEASRLQRLAIVSLEMLRDAAEDFNDEVINRHTSWAPPTSKG